MFALDSARDIATPEGCSLTLRLAGPVVRARAFFIDVAIRAVILIVLSVVLAIAAGGLGVGVRLLAIFALEWFYPILFEVFGQGATPGKRACKLVVLHDDGTPVEWGSSFVRNTVRAVDFLPFLYGVGLLAMLFGNGFQRIGDLAAGTVVVYRNEPEPGIELGEAVTVMANPIDLKLDEQRALIDYVRRSSALTEERAEELALLAGPVVEGLGPAAARRRLLALGQHLIGQSR